MKSTKKSMNYLLDDEGYVVVVFIDADNSVGFTINRKHKRMADKGELTKEVLLAMDYTDMLRLATYKPAGDIIYKETGLRPLPLKEPFRLFAHQVKTLCWMRQKEEEINRYGLRGGIARLKQGLGKCHAFDTPILMWDGTIKLVQNIKKGELICGDDSTPRTVLSTTFGRETMYRITPVKGEPYIVNESHILSLKVSGNKNIFWTNTNNQWQVNWLDHTTLQYRSRLLGKDYKEAQDKVNLINSPDILDISVMDYLNLGAKIKARLMGYRASVEWPFEPVPLDPYIFGVWLGDGSSGASAVTNIDPEVLDALEKFSKDSSYVMKQISNTITYYISGGLLKEMKVKNNKHVPLNYKRNSREVRLQLLAGLIDTDGSLTGGCFDIIQKRKVLAEDICYLSRSCGFAAYMKQCKKGCWYKGEYREGTYYRVTISGNIGDIPVKISRKQAQPRLQIKNVLVTGIKVEELGEDWYFGFTLDGNHRYLLGDFTVTHNTATALALILTSPKGDFPSLVVCSKTVMYEWKSQGIEKFFGRNIKALYFHKDFLGQKNLQNISRKDILDYEIVITTYDVITAKSCKKYREETYEIGEEHTLMVGKKLAIHQRTRKQADRPLVKGVELLYCTPWHRIVCDESQRFANPKTIAYECVMALYSEKRWCLTGTPIRNFKEDIWAQLRFCGYNGVTRTIDWKKMGETKFREHSLDDNIFSMDYKEANIILPPKTEYVNFVELTGKQKIYYDWLLGETRDAFDDMMKGGCSFACVLVLFLRLRQSAIAPYLTTNQALRKKLTAKQKKAEEEATKKIKEKFANSGMYKWLTDINTESGILSVKIREIVDIINRIPKNEKVLVFSMFTSCTDLLAEALKKFVPDFEYEQVDGGVTGKERTDLIDRFRKDSKLRGLFMTYKVGSEGLNLIEATHCICIEPWWTNAVHEQAKARCWRMGQTKEVHIHNIYVQDTIEEKILDICKSKDEMASYFLEGTEKPLGRQVKLDKFTLGKILGVL